MSYDLHIVKTRDRLDAQVDPITKVEVDHLVEQDKELDWSTTDFMEITNEDGKSTKYFAIKWQNVPAFWWRKNEIVCHNPDENQIFKIIEMADILKAFVVGDDGEIYKAKKTFFGKKKLSVDSSTSTQI